MQDSAFDVEIVCFSRFSDLFRRIPLPPPFLHSPFPFLSQPTAAATPAFRCPKPTLFLRRAIVLIVVVAVIIIITDAAAAIELRSAPSSSYTPSSSVRRSFVALQLPLFAHLRRHLPSVRPSDSTPSSIGSAGTTERWKRSRGRRERTQSE